MKKIYLLLFAFASLNSFAGLKSVAIVASGGSPIPIAYGSGSQSKAVECDLGSTVAIWNMTASRIAVMNFKASTVPSSTAKDQNLIPEWGQAGVPGLTIQQGDYLYLRSDSGAPITAGYVLLHCI